ncbi:hypothetical protein [Thiomonas sp. FB-6]|nr:hypothetical protein [Thiomonas sp. FB-6]
MDAPLRWTETAETVKTVLEYPPLEMGIQKPHAGMPNRLSDHRDA